MITLKNYLEKNDKTIPLRLPESILERVKVRARAHRTTNSSYVRAAILKFLDEEESKLN